VDTFTSTPCGPGTHQHTPDGDFTHSNRNDATTFTSTTAAATDSKYRCYIDASAEPNNTYTGTIQAGLDIFILHFQEQVPQSIYIKARLHSCTSALMAEAAALALAATVCTALNFTGVNFLSDCEQLVHHLRCQDIAHPPDGRIKFFTRTYINTTVDKDPYIFKIDRRLNMTADNLARQATTLLSAQQDFNFICTTQRHTLLYCATKPQSCRLKRCNNTSSFMLLIIQCSLSKKKPCHSNQ
jgi:hypothetical protein